ncbi:hypothetical protein, partial [Bilophila wadsworthia]|uniref:hypothetical protein n=1 Tax=Bilophila wadsworthia TaxID=35833 RepID=UPI003AB4BFF3
MLSSVLWSGCTSHHWFSWFCFTIKGRGASAPRFLFGVELIGYTGKIGEGEENLSLERFSSPENNILAFDAAITARRIDENGFMHVDAC